MKVLAVIPARFASTRLPGKPLALIGGKPMIQHVFERVTASGVAQRVVVATDDERVADAVRGFGGEALLTSTECSNGTERCAVVLKQLNEQFEVLLNVQGDEPFVLPRQLHALLKGISHSNSGIVTMRKTISAEAEINNPSVVKVVCNAKGQALYFSRLPIPFHREAAKDALGFNKHLGLYAFRSAVIEQLVQLPQSKLEQAEQLEQLRWLEHGFSIQLMETDADCFSVDTPEDLEQARHIFDSLRNNHE